MRSQKSPGNESRAVEGSVLVVGMGGLGVPAVCGLVRGGVRRLGLVDPDPVELSNLARQVIYGASSLGRLKVEAAAERLREGSESVAIETCPFALSPTNARGLVRRYDFVIDATDDPAAKFLINDVCLALGKPFVYAGVLGMTGQAMTVLAGRTACLRCLFEEPPDTTEIASCREAGIIGPVAAVIGEIEAAEAIRWLAGGAPELAGKILTYEAGAHGRIRVTPVNVRAGCGCAGAAVRGAERPAAARSQ